MRFFAGAYLAFVSDVLQVASDVTWELAKVVAG